jgi:hypothetical protein
MANRDRRRPRLEPSPFDDPWASRRLPRRAPGRLCQAVDGLRIEQGGDGAAARATQLLEGLQGRVLRRPFQAGQGGLADPDPPGHRGLRQAQRPSQPPQGLRQEPSEVHDENSWGLGYSHVHIRTVMRTSQRRYKAAWSAYKVEWDLVDQVLYKFCRRHPGHGSKALNAKLRLIGRTYETGIERGMRRKGRRPGAEGKALNQLADHLHEAPNRRAFADLAGRLAPIRPPATLTCQALETTVVAHGRFVDLLKPVMRKVKPVMRKERSPRSFASKYLHFHCPAVPIMDSNADNKLSSEYPWRTVYEVFPRPAGADPKYYRFALRFWQVYRRLRKEGVHVSVRGVDRYLLWGQRQKGPRPRRRDAGVGRRELPSRRQIRSA